VFRRAFPWDSNFTATFGRRRLHSAPPHADQTVDRCMHPTRPSSGMRSRQRSRRLDGIEPEGARDDYVALFGQSVLA
jgi:hypothetical protein